MLTPAATVGRVGRRFAWPLLLAATWLAPVLILAIGFDAPARFEESVLEPPASAVTEVGVRAMKFPTSVRMTATTRQSRDLVSARAGVVTSIDVAVGDYLTSGLDIVHVDGVAVAAQVGGIPFYRPLSAGDRGNDVVALATFLEERGVMATQNSTDDALPDVFGEVLTAAVNVYQAQIGAFPTGTFDPTSTVYVPEDFGQVAAIDIDVGSRIDLGASLVSSEPALTTVDFSAPTAPAMPRPLLSAPVVLKVAGRGHELSGMNPRDDELVALAAFVREAIDDGSVLSTQTGTQLVVDGLILELQDAVSFAAVPRAAVSTHETGELCVVVVTAGARRAVRWPADSTFSQELAITLGPPELVDESVVVNPSREASVLCG